MKKIVFAFDGLKFSHQAFQYALWITKKENAHLVGVSLESIFYSSLVPAATTAETSCGSEIKYARQADTKARNAAVHLFDAVCMEEGIQYTLHRDHYYPTHELLLESLYADLLIIDSQETMSSLQEALPSRFIRHLLQEIHCPILVVNRPFAVVQKVVLLFDGSPSSVHAVKMFNYLLPAIQAPLQEIITVNMAYESDDKPVHRLMKEFMEKHCPGAVRIFLRGRPGEAIVDYLKKNATSMLVVMGASDVKPLHRMFHSGLAEMLLQRVNTALLITRK